MKLAIRKEKLDRFLACDGNHVDMFALLDCESCSLLLEDEGNGR